VPVVKPSQRSSVPGFVRGDRIRAIILFDSDLDVSAGDIIRLALATYGVVFTTVDFEFGHFCTRQLEHYDKFSYLSYNAECYCTGSA
jgi:hypothetical protein